jgi:phage tail-like protein
VKQELKAVSFYGLSLLGGCRGGLEDTAGYTLELSGDTGGYITPMFDTGEAGCSFNRLVVDALCEEVRLEVIVMATDETSVLAGNRAQRLESYLRSDQVPYQEKANTLRALPHVRAVNAKDILLHSLRGRYLWIYVTFTREIIGQSKAELRGLRLELPKISFTEYFPEIYEGNEFFDRYMGIFQSLFLDVERRVDGVPRLLDYRTTPDENVEYLAGWLGIDNSRRLFSPSQLRYLIAHIDLFQGAKGTKRALESAVELLTGIKPRIVEQFEWLRPGMQAAQLAANRRLYGETRDHFCVILNLAGAEPGVSEADIGRIIEEYSPLGSQFRLVLLSACCNTDTHCYLDVNGTLSVPETAMVGGGAFGEDIMFD